MGSLVDTFKETVKEKPLLGPAILLNPGEGHKILKSKEKKADEMRRNLDAANVQAEAQARFESEQQAAATKARDRMIELRLRRSNRGGTLLTSGLVGGDVQLKTALGQ